MDQLHKVMTQRWFPWVVLGIAALMALPFRLVTEWSTSAAYADSPPSCYGIGWGCSLSPDDAGMLAAFLWLLALAAVAVILLITEFFWQRVALGRSILSLVAAVLLVAWILFIVGAGLT